MYPVILYQTFVLNAMKIGNKIVNLENTLAYCQSQYREKFMKIENKLQSIKVISDLGLNKYPEQLFKSGEEFKYFVRV